MTQSLDDSALAQGIAEVALLRGEFVLRSGKVSNYYLDKYLFSTQPHLLEALAIRFAARIPSETHRLAGAELGGIPLVTATSLKSGLPTIFIRNQRKDYGTSKQLEGKLEPSDRVVLLEDICTSGGQVLEAAKVIESEGAVVIKIISTIDRLEGARARIEEAGYAFESLFTRSDLGV